MRCVRTLLGFVTNCSSKAYSVGVRDTRVLFKTTALPNQAFSAGPRLTADEKVRLAAALTAPEAAAATEKLRAAFKAEQLVATNYAEYHGIAQYLSSEWGHYQ